uniref:Uncharacterized protein n=1 Tax=Candidozyma auris TaxID=498019 RepID=A0A0L0NRS3_CANAR
MSGVSMLYEWSIREEDSPGCDRKLSISASMGLLPGLRWEQEAVVGSESPCRSKGSFSLLTLRPETILAFGDEMRSRSSLSLTFALPRPEGLFMVSSEFLV